MKYSIVTGINGRCADICAIDTSIKIKQFHFKLEFVYRDINYDEKNNILKRT